MDIKERLRYNATYLRTTSMPLAELIPLLQQAADEIERLEKLQRAGVIMDEYAGYCAFENCACGGDLPRVRAGCGNWRLL